MKTETQSHFPRPEYKLRASVSQPIPPQGFENITYRGRGDATFVARIAYFVISRVGLSHVLGAKIGKMVGT